MKRKTPYILLMAAYAALAPVMSGCTDQKLDNVSVTFSYDLPYPGEPPTRSILTAPDIENLLTCISIFVYEGDALVCSSYYEGDFSEMTFDLKTGRTYDVYALANMGDMADAMPSDISSMPVESVSWTIPSYSSVNENGIPMSGYILDFTAAEDEAEIQFRRLFAKVCTNISCDYEGASVSSVKVMNLNSTLRPFGISAAVSRSSIMSEVESASGDGTYILFVPENMQGQVGSATESHQKNPDLDPDINARKDVLTYLETVVTMDIKSGYEGTVTYRSYLGCDDTKNFDIKGNCIYNWNILYMEKNLQHNDWKIHTDDMSSGTEGDFRINAEWDDDKNIEL